VTHARCVKSHNPVLRIKWWNKKSALKGRIFSLSLKLSR
jgi:hypothetical protein